MRIVHYGNRADGGGGIASVIRRHVSRAGLRADIVAVPTFDQDASKLSRKYVPYVTALFELIREPHWSVVHVHLSQRASIVREGFIAVLAWLMGHRVVVTLHGSGLLTAGLLTRVALKVVFRACMVVHGFSERYVDALGVPRQKWIMIPNDVVVPVRVVEKNRSARRLVLFAGEVGERKGIDQLLDAWQLIRKINPDCELIIAGPVSSRGREILEGHTDTLGWIWVGELPHSALISYYERVEIVVQPSRAEAFPMTVCEALAHGCAVVGTNVGGLGELLHASGQVVADNDPESLCRAVCDLLYDVDLIDSVSSCGRAYAVSSLSSDAVDDRWRMVYCIGDR